MVEKKALVRRAPHTHNVAFKARATLWAARGKLAPWQSFARSSRCIQTKFANGSANCSSARQRSLTLTPSRCMAFYLPRTVRTARVNIAEYREWYSRHCPMPERPTLQERYMAALLKFKLAA